jgi:hypothetical protein
VQTKMAGITDAEMWRALIRGRRSIARLGKGNLGCLA